MIGFVLLNYMAYEETFNCVESIKKLDDNNIIVIVDNHSPNESYDIIKNKYINDKNIVVIDSKSNVGFAKGNNIGYQYLKNNFKCEFIIIMNTDMIIEQNDFLNTLKSVFEKTKFDVLGPDIFSTKDNRHQNPESLKNYSIKELKKIYFMLNIKYIFSFLFYIKWGIFKIFKIKNKKKKCDSQYENELYNVVLHGSFYAFSRNFIDSENNAFFDKTFMYFESYILAYFCQKKGYKMVYSPKLKVIHHEDASTDMAYSKKYKKAIFTNKCLRNSCKEYIRLLENDINKK